MPSEANNSELLCNAILFRYHFNEVGMLLKDLSTKVIFVYFCGQEMVTKVVVAEK